MKQWSGYWLIGVGILHIAVTIAMTWQVWIGLIQKGIVNTVGSDPLSMAAFWSVAFGLALLGYGFAIRDIENTENAKLSQAVKSCLIVLILFGIILMPISGFWLAIPPALSLLFSGKPVTG